MQEHFSECIDRLSEPGSPMPCTNQLHRRNRHLVLKDNYDKIIDSVTAAHLRRTLTIPTPNRHRTISQLAALLIEKGPSTLQRFDVASFFENVDRSAALQRLRTRVVGSSIDRRALERFDTTCITASIEGLPRGLALSSVISDWLLSELDANLANQPGVYFYSRFVDDIVLLAANSRSARDFSQIATDCLSNIPGNLSLNTNKGATIAISEHTDSSRLSASFDFLGYRFESNDSHRGISIDISCSKAKRIKSRMIASFCEFCRTNHFPDLLTSMRFLSGNTALVRRGVKARAMRTGIYYSYPALTSDTYEDGTLCALDRFARAVLFGSKTKLSNNLQKMLVPAQKKMLLRCSFVAGHRDKIFFRISRDKAQKLVEGWRHEQ